MESNYDQVNKKSTLRNIFFLVALGVVTVVLLLKFLPKNSLPVDDILKAVPLDASVIVRTNNFNNLVKKSKHNSFFNEIGGFEPGKQLVENIYYVDSISDYLPHVKQYLKGEVLISFHLIGIDNIRPVFYIPVANKYNHQTKGLIYDLVGDKGLISERKYENFQVYDCKIKKGNRNFSFTFYKGFLLLSTSSILLENAMRQVNTDIGIQHSGGFSEVNKTVDKSSLANVFLQYKHLPSVMALALTNQLGTKLKRENSFADWSAFDFMLKDDVLMLNGYTTSSDSLNNVLSILEGQEPRKFTLHSIFPAICHTFYSILLSDPVKYKQAYSSYLNKNGELGKYRQMVANYKKKYSVDIEQLIYEVLESELGVVHCNINSGENQSENYFVISTKGENLARPKFMELLTAWASSEGRTLNDFTLNYTIDEGASYKIFRFPESSVIQDLFGVFFSYNQANYFTFINNYLVFSSSSNALSKLIYANVLNKTLDNTLEYSDFSEYVNSRSNMFFYLKLPKSNEYLKSCLSDNVYNLYRLNLESFEKINTISYQISGEDKMLYNNITVSYVEKRYDNPVTQWETLLDTAINFKPVFVENHYTHEYEIFVQDLKNNIYLINNSGRIVWKIKLDGEIKSEVYQVDYYKNGKLQLLFNTSATIHLIDRNGNYVERYPVKLRSQASAGLALFDYDNNKNYRIFIPSANKKIYAYGIDGNLVSGWDFNATDHEVLRPIQHFRENGRDYIVFGDKYKTYIQDRRGNVRVKPEKNFTKSVQNIYYEDKINGKNCLVTTNEAGTIFVLYFDGTVETYEIKNFTDQHYFELNDVDADGENDFIFFDQHALEVYNKQKRKILSYEFPGNIASGPSYYYFSARDRKIGITDSNDEKIYLINNDGKFYKGFPLLGNSKFSIGILENNYGRFNLIVGGKNNYLYNYAIN